MDTDTCGRQVQPEWMEFARNQKKSERMMTMSVEIQRNHPSDAADTRALWEEIFTEDSAAFLDTFDQITRNYYSQQ